MQASHAVIKNDFSGFTMFSADWCWWISSGSLCCIVGLLVAYR